MSITAIVENDTIKLPIHLPDGTRVEVTVPGDCAADAAEELALFRRLQREIGLTPAAAAEWKSAIHEGRR